MININENIFRYEQRILKRGKIAKLWEGVPIYNLIKS